MSAAEIIQVCSWCLPMKITVLNPMPRPGELSLFVDARGLYKVTRGRGPHAIDLQISHGICPEHAAKFRPEPARKQ